MTTRIDKMTQIEPEELITKFTQLIKRDDGSQVRIVATDYSLVRGFPPVSVGVDVFKRNGADAPWALCNDRPIQGWREMSVDDYVKHGRSEMLQAASPGEILKTISMIGKPMSAVKTDELESGDCEAIESVGDEPPPRPRPVG